LLNTVARTGKVLALFTHERPEWGVTEVSAALGLPKSNAHEMLSSLTVIGLLQRTAESRYRLGWRLLAISHNLVRTGGLERASGIILATLSRRVGVTSHVGAWDGRRIICVSGTTGSSQLALPRHPVGTPNRSLSGFRSTGSRVSPPARCPHLTP
jgi:DNA-binding IclR family transcriptional regulator